MPIAAARRRRRTTRRRRVGVTAQGRLRPGYRYLKGGRVVKARKR